MDGLDKNESITQWKYQSSILFISLTESCIWFLFFIILMCVWTSLTWWWTCVLQGNDEEAVLDQGKTSSTLNTNFEKEELESEFLRKAESKSPSVFTTKHEVTELTRPVFTLAFLRGCWVHPEQIYKQISSWQEEKQTFTKINLENR